MKGVRMQIISGPSAGFTGVYEELDPKHGHRIRIGHGSWAYVGDGEFVVDGACGDDQQAKWSPDALDTFVRLCGTGDRREWERLRGATTC